jgi:hypothetical protein
VTLPSPALNEDCIDQAIEASIESSSRCRRLEISTMRMANCTATPQTSASVTSNTIF